VKKQKNQRKEQPMAELIATLQEEIRRGGVNSKDYSNGDSALHAAARWGRLDAIKLLLASSAAVSDQNYAGQTPLHCASAEGHVGACELLLAGGAVATVDTPDMEGACPLLPAAGKGHTETVRLLVAHGASVNTPNTTHGLTPLLWASARGHLEIVEVLLLHSAAVRRNRTMVHAAKIWQGAAAAIGVGR
jgi:ankyrin repeat protein